MPSRSPSHLLLWSLLIIAECQAQGGSGVLTGKVTDPSGRVVQGASVVVTNEKVLDFRRGILTNESGNFQLKLPPGRYVAHISYRGFSDAEVKDIVIEPNREKELSVELSLRHVENIVVTARKYEEELQNVPMSIAAFDAAALEDLQVHRLDDLTLHTPNLNFFRSRGSADNGAIFIRGIGQEDNVFTADAGVALYLDGVLLPLPQGELLDMLDVDRIEVLRGPQGTLYGKNTSAGAVKYMTHPPEDRLGGEVEFLGGNYWHRDFSGTLNVPIVHNKLLSRTSIGSFVRDGFEFNTFTRRHTDSKDSLVGRTSLLYRATPKLDFTFRADGVRERPLIHVGSLLRPETTALTYPDLLAGNFVTFPVPSNAFTVSANTQDRIAIDTWGTAAEVNWRPSSSFSVTSLSSYRLLDNNSRVDFDSTPASAADVFILQNHKQASEEIQVVHSSARWNTVGGFFFFDANDHEFDGTDASAKGFSTDATYRQRARSAAWYGETVGRVSERISIALGLRYTFETKEFGRQAWFYTATDTPPDYNLYGGCGTGPGGSPPSCFPGNGGTNLTNIPGESANWSAWTPRFSLNYNVNQGIMVYTSVSRGFKSGGFNGRASVLSSPHDAQPYKPEYVWTYEGGARVDWFNRRLIGGLTYFYNDYRDLQLQTFVAPSNGAPYESLFTNAGKAVTQGFELDIKSRPLSRLGLFASAGYTDAKYVQFLDNGIDISKQRSIPNAPRWTASAGSSYAIPVRHTGFNIDLGEDVDFQGPRFLTVSNLLDLRQGGYSILNAFLTLEAPEQRWSIQVGGRNLADKRYMVAGLDGSPQPFGIVTGFWGDPRTWTIGVKARF